MDNLTTQPGLQDSSPTTGVTTAAAASDFVSVFDFERFETASQWMNAILLPAVYLALILFTLFSGNLVCRVCSHNETSTKSTKSGLSITRKSGTGPVLDEDGKMSSSEAAARIQLARSLSRSTTGRSATLRTLAEVEAPPSKISPTHKRPKDEGFKSRRSSSASNASEGSSSDDDSAKTGSHEEETKQGKQVDDPADNEEETVAAESSDGNKSPPSEGDQDADAEKVLEKHIEKFFLKGFRMEFLEYYRTFEDFSQVMDRDPPMPSQALRVSYHNKGRKVRLYALLLSLVHVNNSC